MNMSNAMRHARRSKTFRVAKYLATSLKGVWKNTTFKKKIIALCATIFFIAGYNGVAGFASAIDMTVLGITVAVILWIVWMFFDVHSLPENIKDACEDIDGFILEACEDNGTSQDVLVAVLQKERELLSVASYDEITLARRWIFQPHRLYISLVLDNLNQTFVRHRVNRPTINHSPRKTTS